MSSANTLRPSITWVIPALTMLEGLALEMSEPLKVIDPLVMSPSCTSSNPETALTVVVFPDPLAPSSATIEPSGTSMERPRSTKITSL